MPLLLSFTKIKFLEPNHQILTRGMAEKKLRRMAYEIVERNAWEKKIVLAGIKENGFVIAGIIQKMVAMMFKGEVELLGISLDKKNPGSVSLDRNADLSESCVIIVDDVANSGRTMLYALKPFLDLYPKKIQTLVLVERSHKAFPVNADYTGISIATSLRDHINVEVENGSVTGAWFS